MRELSPIITPDTQKETLDQVFARIDQAVAERQKPVVELDLDLTTMIPRRRTLKALEAAGRTYDIDEFIHAEQHFDVLPGYTREAWTAFIGRFRLPERYPRLRWLGKKDGVGPDANVYSAFHTSFWTTEWLSEDVLTPGVAEFVERVRACGGEAVFVSGRWEKPQFQPSFDVLERGGVENPVLLIGNPHHDDPTPISDSECKALRQPEIRQKYGVPVAFVDDRLDNRDAVLKANPGIDMLSIGIAIPGFSYDEETTGISAKTSTFEL